MSKALKIIPLLLLNVALGTGIYWWVFREDPNTPKLDLDASSVTDPHNLKILCGSCHVLPKPDIVDKATWKSIMDNMVKMLDGIGVELKPHEIKQLLAYFQDGAPEKLPRLPDNLHPSPLLFKPSNVGHKVTLRPLICNVNIVDLNQDKKPEILVCDAESDRVIRMVSHKGKWSEEVLCEAIAPAHTAVFDFEGDGDLDIVVAVLGFLRPSDDRVGEVRLLLNNGSEQFEEHTLLKGIDRVADVEPGDFDRDGDTDFIVGMFGWRKTGQIALLEQTSDMSFQLSPISDMRGTIHVPVYDFNHDGFPDFAALIAQENEQILLFLNDGEGQFESLRVFRAPHPNFGSSGIQLVDLDQDKDMDILYTNGDAFDTYDKGYKPYHGVQWLENLGNLKFQYHDIIRFYGVYRAVAEDLDQDGDLDIVVASMFNDWKKKNSQGLCWLENDGKQKFTGREMPLGPTHLVTVDTGDMNGDGRPDIVVGGMHVFGPFDRKGRVTLWTNLGPKEKEAVAP